MVLLHSSLHFLGIGLFQSVILVVAISFISSFQFATLLVVVGVSTIIQLLEWRMVVWQIRHCIPDINSENISQISSLAVGNTIVPSPEKISKMVWNEILLIRSAFEEISGERQNHWVQLLGRLSHELNTNLHAILGAVQVLADSDSNHDFVRIVSHAGSVMANIVSDFLDFSLCEEGQLTLSIQAFAVPSIVQHLKMRFDEEAKRMNLSLEFILAEGLNRQQVNGDFDRLYQVLTNLLCNAFLAVQEMSIPARVAVHIKFSDDHQSVLFSVSDNGCGIAKEDQEKLFLPFSRVSKASRHNAESSPGCGLGLCICRHLVTLMGGEIALVSEFGQGTSVNFTIPVAPAPSFSVIGTSSFPTFTGSPSTLRPGALLYFDVHARLSRVPALALARRSGLATQPSARTRGSSFSQSLPSSRLSSRLSSRQKRGGSTHSHRSTNTPSVADTLATHRTTASSIKGTGVSPSTQHQPLPRFSAESPRPASHPGYCGGSKEWADEMLPEPPTMALQTRDGSTSLPDSPSSRGHLYMHPSVELSPSTNHAFLQVPMFNSLTHAKSSSDNLKPPGMQIMVNPLKLRLDPDAFNGIPPMLPALTGLASLRRSAIPTIGSRCSSITLPSPHDNEFLQIPSIPIHSQQITITPETSRQHHPSNDPLPSSFTSEDQQLPLICFIVDDNTINLLLLRRMLLKTLNCEVFSSTSAMDLLVQIRNRNLERRAVVLTDVHMPEMNGLQLTQELRRNWSPPQLPVFGVTADYTMPMREECMRVGMQGVVAKPTSCLGLLELMINLLTALWGEVPPHFIKLRPSPSSS